ncbi:MAG: HesA/MoeB/ThiF family protein [Flavipsychrobacter sp.]|nr:HesA/MoeB/ThiF family protein [Flavipsychrobacter sp.]
MVNDIRYSCQVALPGFGTEAQARLNAARVLVVGAGGLGCPAAQYLTAVGVGTIGIADYDVISISNLHRQILYTPAEAGQKKVTVACKKLQQQNPQIQLVAHDVKITSANVMELVGQYDIVLDATDNFETRYLLNDACVLQHKPVVYGAIYQYEGQVAVWNVPYKDTYSPNYRDVFPDANAAQIPNCAEGGVLPTLAGIIGCMQANEVVKYITGTGELVSGKMLLFDALTMQIRVVKIGDVTRTNITEIAATVDACTISAQELKAGLDDNKYTLVDVREISEREAYHIGGLHIPLSKIEHEEFQLPVDKDIVFYCASGRRSAVAATLLSGKVDAKLFSLSGGLKGWRQ